MPNEALPNKREVMLALLAETSVFVHLDPRGSSVRVPPWFKNQPQLVLQIGLNMAVQIPDLDVGEQGISCTLSFSRRPFFCSIPWGSVFGLVGDNGPGLVWPDDVPAEIAAQVQAQTQGQSAKSPAKKPNIREAPRGRLRAVGTEQSAGEPSSDQAKGAAEVRPVPVAEAMPALAAVDEGSSPRHPPVEANREIDAEEQAADPPAPQPSRKPAQSARPGAKRELPPYLRVVK
jgi:hypothetical protein